MDRDLDFSLSGIYKIINKVNGYYYVGSARHISFKNGGRFEEHIDLLRKQKHFSRLLQNAWDMYGENNFSFEIVENNISYSKLRETEQKYLDIAKTHKYNCYNSKFVAGRTSDDLCQTDTQMTKEEYNKKYYQTVRKRKASDKRELLITSLNDLRRNKCCFYCGADYIRVLTFFPYEDEILLKAPSVDFLIDTIKDCEIVCLTCSVMRKEGIIQPLKKKSSLCQHFNDSQKCIYCNLTEDDL